MSFRGLFQHFTEMGKYFIAATIVFTVGIWLGFSNSEQFDIILQSQLEGLKGIAEQIMEKENPMLWLFGFIFLNNAIKSVLVVFSGIVFGIFPLFFLLINGMILGYLANLQVQAGEMGVFLTGILPHGVIEIPMILIASAYGIKLGTIMLKGIGGLIQIRSGSSFSGELARFMKIALPLSIFLVVSLLIAAIIESTITPWLLSMTKK